MKTRISIVMLVLGCLIVMSVYAAEKADTETAPVPTPPAVTAAAPSAEKAVSLATEMDKISYIIGTQLAGSIRRAKVEVNTEAVVQGLSDALTGKKPPMSQAEMKTVYDAWLERRKQELAAEQAKAAAERAKAAAKRAQEAPANLAAGTAFLEANKTKDGVVVLPSGLQYKVIKEGTGKTPVATDTIKAHYRGKFVDGKVFQSSFEGGTPVEFPVTQVIDGWTEALLLMKEGAKWELYIPANLAYKETGKPPSIPPNSALIFDIELIEIVKPAKPAEVVK